MMAVFSAGHVVFLAVAAWFCPTKAGEVLTPSKPTIDDVDLKQPPIVDGVIGGHACDIFYNLCMEVKMTVSNAHNSTGLRCRFSSQTGGKPYAETVLAVYENFREVKCMLPFNMNLVITGMETVQVVKVSLANDGKNFGTDTKFTIYDSGGCYKCDGKGDCTLKPLKCFIGNRCYNAGETHPTNSAMSCEPGISVDHWVDNTGSAGAQDPCVSHTVLKEPWRLDSVVTDQTNPRCDDNLQSGWYRFVVPGGTGRMTNVPDHSKAVPTSTCGTMLPLAFIGTHPSVNDGIVVRQMCYNFGDDLCSLFSAFSEKIQIRNCGKFFVYKLFSPKCNQAFCAETSRVDLKPTVITLVSDNDIFLECHHNSTIGYQRYTVTWYANDDVIQTGVTSGAQDKVTWMPLSKLLVHNGKKVTCTITVGKVESDRSEALKLGQN